jgi:hypothetical protein
MPNDIDVLTDAVHSFYQQILSPSVLKILNPIFSSNLGPHYLFDVYINRRNEVTLIDLCVNHEAATDPKMFGWEELTKWEEEEVGVDQCLDVRFVEKEVDALPSQLPQHRVPADMVGDPKVFMEEFVEATRRGDFDKKR